MLVGTVTTQDNRIAQFAIWKPLIGQEAAFQKGYKRHLQWHRAAGDTWEWYGWYISSGPRAGQFVDATFDHFWSDFDKPVDPEADLADNQLNVYPYADLQSVFKVALLTSQSISNPASLRSKRLRMLTVRVADVPSGVRILDRLRAPYRNNPDMTTYLVFKTVDGGEVNELILLIGFDSWEHFGKTENIQDQMSAIETSLKVKTIQSVTSETLTYRADLSLFGE